MTFFVSFLHFHIAFLRVFAPMSSSATISEPQDLHPSLWLASQLAQTSSRCIDTGFATLSAQLPGNGWPTGNLIDLLVQPQNMFPLSD